MKWMMASHITSQARWLMMGLGKNLYDDKFLLILSFGSIAIRE